VALPPPSIPLAGGTLDRAAQHRHDDAWLTAAAARQDARALVLPGGDVEPLAGRDALALLGVQEDGLPLWLVDGDGPPGDLRAAAARADGAHAGLLAYAVHLAHFHRTHAFCGTCGRPAAPADAGHARRCPQGHTVHPRTDPVVIMLVVDGDRRCLLGRQPSWPAGRFSALAGFVEPGEPLETAVAREVAEEAGVEVDAVRYVASQPWPFPQSLMLGFEADWAAGDPAPGDDELEDARWFARDEVAAAARHDVGWEPDGGAGLILPPRLAIARHLVEGWLARTG
jgi:NAD+ diphosphatase